MSICYAAITPHTPLLLPTLGKDKRAALEHTIQALHTMSAHLHAHRPDIIVLLSPHAKMFESTFSLGASLSYTSRFDQFGDLSTSYTYQGAPHAAAQLSERLRQSGYRAQLVAESTLDYGVAIPLTYILPPTSPARIIPVGFTGQSPREHYHFGQALREAILDTDLRVAIIASGDLSHDISQNRSSDTLDNLIEEALRQRHPQQLLHITQTQVREADVCAYLPLLLLTGVLDTARYRYRRLAYEHPFGVGYLTAECLLS